MTPAPGDWEPRPDRQPVPPPRPDDAPSSAATPPRPGPGIIRPMPTSGDGPSFEALNMQSVLSRARDSSRFDAPPPETGQDAPRRRFPVRALLLLAVAVLVLGVAAGALWVFFFREVPVDDETLVKVSGDEVAETLSPQQAVLGYLEALADGDVEKALSYGPPPTPEHSRVLLTSTAQRAMPPEARPSNIRILTEDPLATEVDVLYTISGETVSRPIRVTRLPNDSYELEHTTVAIQLQIVGGDSLPVLVNGVPVEHRVPLEVVPGTYTPTTGRPFLDFPATAAFSILSLAHTGITEQLITPELTGPGRDAFLDAARASLERCIASSELAPAGCPNAIRAPRPVVPGSVRWHLRNENLWASTAPTLSPRDQSVAVATVPLRLRVTMDYAGGGSSGPDEPELNATVSATMLGDASPVTVHWER